MRWQDEAVVEDKSDIMANQPHQGKGSLLQGNRLRQAVKERGRLHGPERSTLPSLSSKRMTVWWDRLTIFFLLLAMSLGGYAASRAFLGPRLVLPEIALDDQRGATTEPVIVRQEVASFENYKSISANRDIFQATEEIDDDGSPRSTPDDPGIRNLVAKYKLVGLIVDDHPRAVVEEVGSQNVRFLSIGESFGDAVLKKIEKGGVWFQYQGQLIQLKFSEEEK